MVDIGPYGEACAWVEPSMVLFCSGRERHGAYAWASKRESGVGRTGLTWIAVAPPESRWRGLCMY